MNSAFQTKLAMIALQPLLKELNGLIVMQIHDELVFDLPENVGYDNLRKIADIMCNVVKLDCGMKSDVEAGYKWGQVMSEDEIEELHRKVC